MATKKTKAPVKKQAVKKQATKSKSVSAKKITDLVDSARELAENQILSIEIVAEQDVVIQEPTTPTPIIEPVTPAPIKEPEIIMTTPDAFNSVMGDDVPTTIVSVNTQPTISDQQRALNAIDGLKEKIQFNIHQKQAEVAKEKEVVAEILEEKVEKIVKVAVALDPLLIEENIFTNFIASRPGVFEVNHFELANTGINVGRFEQFEARIGKYKLTRVYMGGPWAFTIIN